MWIYWFIDITLCDANKQKISWVEHWTWYKTFLLWWQHCYDPHPIVLQLLNQAALAIKAFTTCTGDKKYLCMQCGGGKLATAVMVVHNFKFKALHNCAQLCNALTTATTCKRHFLLHKSFFKDKLIAMHRCHLCLHCNACSYDLCNAKWELL